MLDFDFNVGFDGHDEPLEEQQLGRVPRTDQCKTTVRTSVGGIFSYMSPFTSVTRCCFVVAGAGDLEDGGTGDGNNRDQ